MVTFVVTTDVAAPAEVTWRVITDWPAHGRWIPLTHVRSLPVEGATGTPGVGVGGMFVARTGVGPLGFDDVMEITHWQPPGADGADGADGVRAGRCDVVKRGRVVLGGASFEVIPTSGGSRVTWTEDASVVPVRLTRPFDPLVKLIGRGGLASAMKRMAAEAEAAA